jgi:hypothetical protein
MATLSLNSAMPESRRLSSAYIPKYKWHNYDPAHLCTLQAIGPARQHRKAADGPLGLGSIGTHCSCASLTLDL